MRYRVKISISYCESFFDFEDALEACNFMSTAAEHLSNEGDRTTIGLTVFKEGHKEEE